MSSATRLDMSDFVTTVRGWCEETTDRLASIHLVHDGDEIPVKRFRKDEIEGKTPDELAALIVRRATTDAGAWKGELQTYHVLPFFGQGAQVAAESYSFGILAPNKRPGAAARTGGAPGGAIDGDRDSVIAELVRQNAELHKALLDATGIVNTWSETRTREDRSEISTLREERAAVWSTIDALREVDREGARLERQEKADSQRWEDGAKLLRTIAGPIINRVVGFKALPEMDSPMLAEFRSLFDKMRTNVPVFDKFIEAAQGDPEIQAHFVSLFDRFLDDHEKKQATAMLLAAAQRQLEAKKPEEKAATT